MANTNLLLKAEAAVAGYLRGLDLTDNIYEGKSDGEKVAPCVICQAVSAGEDDPPFSGLKWVELLVAVKTIAAIDAGETETETASATLSHDIFDALNDDTLPALLSAAASGFTCQGVIFDGQALNMEEDCWSDELKLRLYCVARDEAS